jgi:hypothetical protein
MKLVLHSVIGDMVSDKYSAPFAPVHSVSLHVQLATCVLTITIAWRIHSGLLRQGVLLLLLPGPRVFKVPGVPEVAADGLKVGVRALVPRWRIADIAAAMAAGLSEGGTARCLVQQLPWSRFLKMLSCGRCTAQHVPC